MVENAVYHFAFRVTFPVHVQLDPTWSSSVTASANTDVPEFMKPLLKGADKWIYQLECGKDTALYHIQGYYHLIKKVRNSTQKHSWLEFIKEQYCAGFSVYHEPAATEGKDSLKEYCMKVDTRVAGPWADKQIYMGADLPAKLYSWQEHIKNTVLEKPADDRTINWVFDPVGNTGKSKFCKLMEFKHQCPVLEFATDRDLMYLMSQYMGRKAYFLDLTRVKPAMYSGDDMYATMEKIKNGRVMNTKYQTSIQHMMSPHLWVFSNSLPKLEKLSSDRWRVWTINPQHKVLEPYNLKHGS